MRKQNPYKTCDDEFILHDLKAEETVEEEKCEKEECDECCTADETCEDEISIREDQLKNLLLLSQCSSDAFRVNPCICNDNGDDDGQTCEEAAFRDPCCGGSKFFCSDAQSESQSSIAQSPISEMMKHVYLTKTKKKHRALPCKDVSSPFKPDYLLRCIEKTKYASSCDLSARHPDYVGHTRICEDTETPTTEESPPRILRDKYRKKKSTNGSRKEENVPRMIDQELNKMLLVPATRKGDAIGPWDCFTKHEKKVEKLLRDQQKINEERRQVPLEKVEARGDKKEYFYFFDQMPSGISVKYGEEAGHSSTPAPVVYIIKKSPRDVVSQVDIESPTKDSEAEQQQRLSPFGKLRLKPPSLPPQMLVATKLPTSPTDKLDICKEQKMATHVQTLPAEMPTQDHEITDSICDDKALTLNAYLNLDRFRKKSSNLRSPRDRRNSLYEQQQQSNIPMFAGGLQHDLPLAPITAETQLDMKLLQQERHDPNVHSVKVPSSKKAEAKYQVQIDGQNVDELAYVGNYVDDRKFEEELEEHQMEEHQVLKTQLHNTADGDGDKFSEYYPRMVIIECGNQQFMSERQKLADASDWFFHVFTLFGSKSITYIHIAQISPSIYSIIHNWIHSKEMLITNENLAQVYTAALQLRITELIDYCVRVAKTSGIKLPKLKPPVIPYPSRSEVEDEGRLAANIAVQSRNICLDPEAFPHIIASPDFYGLHLNALLRLLNSDDLRIRSELEVFDAAVAWLSYDWPHRVAFSIQVLESVRFYLLNDGEIVDLFFHPKNLPAVALPACRDLILKAYLYKSASKSQELGRLKLSFGPIQQRCYLVPAGDCKISPWDAAIIIQSAWRSYCTRQRVAIQHGAAAIIQAGFRSFLVRRWIREREEANSRLMKKLDREKTCKETAATIIQAHFKGHYVRKHFKELDKSAVVIQKSVRSFLAQKSLQKLKLGRALVSTVAFFGGICHKPKQPVYKEGRQCFVYIPSKNNWKTILELDEPLHYAKATFIGGKIYVTGGCVVDFSSLENIVVSNKAWCWNITSSTWQHISNMRHHRIHHELISSHGNIYAIGGQAETKRLLSSMEMYNMQSKTWYEMAPMFKERMGFSALAFQSYIIVCGGIRYVQGTEKGYVSDSVEIYHPPDDQWTKTNRLRIPRCFSTLLEYMGELFIIGGVEYNSSHKGSSSAIDFYDPETERWQLLTNMDFGRHCVVAFVYNDCLTIAGGLSSITKSALEDVKIFNLKEDRWMADEVTYLPCKLSGAAVVSIPRQVASTINFTSNSK